MSLPRPEPTNANYTQKGEKKVKVQRLKSNVIERGTDLLIKKELINYSLSAFQHGPPPALPTASSSYVEKKTCPMNFGKGSHANAKGYDLIHSFCITQPVEFLIRAPSILWLCPGLPQEATPSKFDDRSEEPLTAQKQ